MTQRTEQEASRDRRTANRSSLYLAASLYCDGSVYPVKIRNISSAGALIECPATLVPDSLVQLVRGSLTAPGVVAWSEGGRCGLSFSTSFNVEQWVVTPKNGDQQRVDEVVRLVRSGIGQLAAAGAASSPLRTRPEDRLSADLRRAFELLGSLGDRRARDGVVVAQYAAELQKLDIAMQVIAALEAAVRGDGDVPIDAARMISLRRSADQALSRAA